MKKSVLTLATLIAFKIVIGQLVIRDNKFISISSFNLGDSISKFEPDLQMIKVYGSDTARSKSYQYTAALKKPVEVTSITFKHVSFEFDKGNKVRWFNFNKPYYEDKEFVTNSRQDYNKLISYVNAAVGMEGEKKVFYPHVHEGRQWAIGDTIILVDLQETAIASSTSVGITVFPQK